ncbi:hypothetical protein MMPV_005389 [Pyropia vietnamensis]
MTEGSAAGGDEAAAAAGGGGGSSSTKSAVPAVVGAAAVSPFGRHSAAAGASGSTIISLAGKAAHGIDIPPSAPTLYDGDDDDDDFESDWDEEEEGDGFGTDALDRDVVMTAADRKADAATATANLKDTTSPQSVAISAPTLTAPSVSLAAPSATLTPPPPLTVRMADDNDDDDQVELPAMADSVDALVDTDVSLEDSFGAEPTAPQVPSPPERDVQMVVVRSASSLTLSPLPSSTPGANIIAAARAARASIVTPATPLADNVSSDRQSGDATSSTSSGTGADGMSAAVAATTTTIAGRTFLAGEHVTIWNRLERRKIAGNAAPLGKNVTKYLNSHPNCEVYVDQDEAERPGASARRAAASARKRARLAAAAAAEAESSALARRAAAVSIPLQRLLAAAADDDDADDHLDRPHVHLDHNGMALSGLPAQSGGLTNDVATAPETPHLTIPDGEHVTIWNRLEGRKIAGSAAPRKANLAAYLTRNPHCEAYDARKHPPTSSSAAAAAAAVAAVRRRVHGVSAEELAQQLSLDPWLVGLDSLPPAVDGSGVAGLADLDSAPTLADDGSTNLEALLSLAVSTGPQANSSSPFALDVADDCGVAALPSTGLDFEAGTSPSGGCIMALL